MEQYLKHKVKKASVDIEYTGQSDGFLLQQDAAEWVKEITDKISDSFSSFVSPMHILQLDELVISIDVAETGWKEAATEEFMKKLNEKLLQVDLTSPAAKKSIASLGDNFLFFLEQGFLPWQVSKAENEGFRENIRTSFFSFDGNFVKQLILLFSSSPLAAERLMNTVPFKEIKEMFSRHKTSFSDETTLLYKDITLAEQLFDKSETKLPSQYRKAFQLLSLQLLASNRDKKSILNELDLFVKKVAYFHSDLTQLLTTAAFQSSFFKDLQSGKFTSKKEYPFVRDGEKKQQNNLSVKTIAAQNEDGIYISNAGLVVVAAFLPALFSKLKLVNQNEITDETMAVCLLQYLATGIEKMQEYELVLPKILCGLSVEQPVNCNLFILTEGMKTEAEQMLLSVIEYWNVLQNTSVEGLQQSFLQRDGKLVFADNQWLLQVEQKSYDILLQQLPWNINMIKLSWMPYLLKTEWIY